MSITAQVEARIGRMRKGVPFSIEGFYDLGRESSIHKAFSRLAKAGEIVRVSKGFYVRPKALKSLPSITVTTSPEAIAKVWAKTNGYKLVTHGFEAAYRLGLQTQAPARTIFWTNGPSREFKIGNSLVQVKHVASSKLKWENKPEGELLRSLLVIKPQNLKPGQFNKAFSRLSISPTQAKYVINKLKHSHLSREWREKLAQEESVLS